MIGWLVAISLGAALLFILSKETSQGNFAEELALFAREVVAKIDSLNPPPAAVGVTAFTDGGGNETQLGRLIATQLTVAIGKKSHRFRLSDRLGLLQILNEHQLAMTGMINTMDAPRVGEITPINMLITGTCQSNAGKILVSAKVVDVTTAEILTGATATLSSTEILNMLAEEDNAVREISLGTAVSTCKAEVVEFASKNYKWIWAAIAAPLLAWIGREYAQRRSGKRQRG